MIKCAIFDLDGVIIDTAKYHYLAWRRLANQLGFDFSVADNERLKGVSRMDSLEILLEVGSITKATERQKEAFATLKNDWYVEYISKIEKDELLCNVEEFLTTLKEMGIKVALGSASKNAPLILERCKIGHLFDAIVDGNMISKAKPDPEVFLMGAKLCGCAPEECVVFEDAKAGIEAAQNGNMMAIAVGNEEIKNMTQIFIPDFSNYKELITKINLKSF